MVKINKPRNKRTVLKRTDQFAAFVAKQKKELRKTEVPAAPKTVPLQMPGTFRERISNLRQSENIIDLRNEPPKTFWQKLAEAVWPF